MTDLEPRLHHLRQTPVPAGPGPAEVRTRADRRKARRHRRLALGAVPVVALLVVAAATALTGNDRSESVVTGTDPITTETTIASTTTAAGPTTTSPRTTLGGLEGLTIDVTPTTDLRDGQLVTVEVGGIEKLTNPIIILCTGDVTQQTAARACDLTPLELGGTSEGDDGFSDTQQVAVRRIIRLPQEANAEDDQGGPWDCATEPAGCALVVGNNSLPATGVGVPVTFSADGLPTPTVSVAPTDGLQDGQELTVDATGLRPNTTYQLTQCGQGDDAVCDEITWPSAKTDGDGILRTTYPAHTAIYGWRGRTDCTSEPCVIQVGAEGSEAAASAPIGFAPDAVAPAPRLEVSTPGPYQDQQVVTVTGTGFRPGQDIGWEIGQCPNDKDTAVEERCGYDTIGDAVVVDEAGTFSLEVRLHRTGACGQPAGCHLGWVINHGPTLAKVPLEFR